MSRFDEAVRSIRMGVGFLPWQERGVSEDERLCRGEIEARKDRYLAAYAPPAQIASYSPAQIAQARENIHNTDWGRDWFERLRAIADHVVAQPEGYIGAMVTPQTAATEFTFSCPACIGVKSIEAVGVRGFDWDYHAPDVIACKACGQTYPDAAYAETGILRMPRRRQEISYYLNDAERAHPDDRTGKYAWRWVGQPVNVSFSGIARFRKVGFMMHAARALTLAHLFTGKEDYALAGKRILLRFAECYPQWIYRDYHDSFADCDPIYAAHHHNALPLVWKRNANEGAYHGATSYLRTQDTLEKAAIRDLWGGGRHSPNVDGHTAICDSLGLAFDILSHAKINGVPLLTERERRTIIRDLLLEHILTIEPFAGPAGSGTNTTNKGPFAYNSFIVLGRILNFPDLVDVGLQGWENTVSKQFLDDGWSAESVSYTEMFLSGLIGMAYRLDGYVWPASYTKRRGRIDMFRQYPAAGRMLKTAAEALCANRFVPMGDTFMDSTLQNDVFLYIQKYLGAAALPDSAAALRSVCEAALGAPVRQGDFAVFNLTDDAIRGTRTDGGQTSPGSAKHPLTGIGGDVYYPNYRLALLRHGNGKRQSAMMMSSNTGGTHMHWDCLNIWWMDRGVRVIGEMGYVCDSPLIAWGYKPDAHNLLFVDGAPGGTITGGRDVRVNLLFSAPHLSAIEAETPPFGSCRALKRRLLVFKGPGQRTFLVEIARVSGGSEHRYRLWSEIGASLAAGNSFSVQGVREMPEIPPHPHFGGSMAAEHVAALHATVSGGPTDETWRGVWRDSGREYRVTFLNSVDRLAVHSAPGQQYPRDDIGRRTRMIDAIRTGEALESVFVAVHEFAQEGEPFAVRHARLLTLPAGGGGAAVALELDTEWFGKVLILNDVADATEIEGITFQGRLGVWARGADGAPCGWCAAAGAATLADGKHGFSGRMAEWAGTVTRHSAADLEVAPGAPRDWPAFAETVVPYVYVERDVPVNPYRRRALPGIETAVETLVYRAVIDGQTRLGIPDYPCSGGTAFRLPYVHFEAW